MEPISPILVDTPSATPAPIRTNKLLFAFILTLPILATTIYLFIPARVPTNPLGHSTSPAIVRQSLSKSETASLAYYLAGSEKYLKEARLISQGTKNNQTDQDKKKIVALLNSSLQMANNAVSNYANNPESYAQRARVLNVIAIIDPSVKTQAESDQKLAGSSTTKIVPTDLVRAAPIEEASLLSMAVIALPQDEIVATDTIEDSNALRGQATLPAGETDITISSDAVRDDLLVYYTPQGDTSGEVISLTNKSAKDKSFTLHLSAPLTHDLLIDWWIVE